MLRLKHYQSLQPRRTVNANLHLLPGSPDCHSAGPRPLGVGLGCHTTAGVHGEGHRATLFSLTEEGEGWGTAQDSLGACPSFSWSVSEVPPLTKRLIGSSYTGVLAFVCNVMAQVMAQVIAFFMDYSIQ